MPTVKKNRTPEKKQEPIFQASSREIRREIDCGSDKLHLILLFPPEPSPSNPADALRQEIRTMLSRELSEQLRYREQEPILRASGKALI